MLERISVGDVPSAPHTALRAQSGALRFEHCITQRGFDGPYSILYHVAPPHTQVGSSETPIDVTPRRVRTTSLAKRHFRTGRVSRTGEPWRASTVLLVNEDLELAITTPTTSDARYVIESDADVLYFIAEGSGALRSVLGDVPFGPHDYVFVPRGVLHRFVLPEGEGSSQRWLRVAMREGFGLLPKHRNDVGQLRMDAPIGHRDFRKPMFVGPVDEGIRALLVRRHEHMHRFTMPESPLDVVGWEGTVYPWAMPIGVFRPRVGKTHLPPDVHGTFCATGALVSSFVPRPLDFGPDAIPCPYPHSSVDCDEVIFYASGDFLSRRGIEPFSMTLHPRGIPHGPVVSAYEGSMGRTHVDEVAVMLDVTRTLDTTVDALDLEDAGYHASYAERGPRADR